MINNIENLHIVIDSDYIECKLCQKKLTKIDGRHTKKVHNIYFNDYKIQFPNSPTITKNQLEKEILSISKRKESKDNNKTKIIGCCNSDCNNKFEVNINQSNKYTLCNECKKNGIINTKTEEIYIAQKNGMIKKYGVDNPSKVKSIVTLKQENLSNKIDLNPDYFRPIIEKRQKTNASIYGDNWPLVLHEKIKKSLSEKYGVEYALQNPNSIKKFEDTYFQRTGYNQPFENPNIIDKIKKSNLEKYGVENVMCNELIRAKSGISLKENWKREDVREKRNQSYINNFIPRLLVFLKENANLELIGEYKDAHFYHQWKCTKCNYKFQQNWNAIQQGYSCPNCRPPKTRDEKFKEEKELSNFIESLGFEIVRSNRELIKPFELDIMIPSKNVAIEYNGLFWHSEEMLKNTRKKVEDVTKYHLNKFLSCQEKNYRLVTIFEDEWLFKNDIVKHRLQQILKVSNPINVHARKCIIKEISSIDKNAFLEKYHLQGKDASTIKLGAFYNNELIAVMTFGKGNVAKGNRSKEGVWELNRFCSNYDYHSTGIAGRLLSYFKQNNDWNEIFSYADLRWSDGNLYNQLGFNLDRVVPPNYWYIDVNKLKRLHRFNLRKTINDPKNITERILRISEGYKIIWDCGNLKFQMKK